MVAGYLLNDFYYYLYFTMKSDITLEDRKYKFNSQYIPYNVDV